MISRKKKLIDGMDREILRFLYNDGDCRQASGAIIAKYVKLSPPAIKPRLMNLHTKGIVKSIIGKNRIFQRKFGNQKMEIKSPNKIVWGIDLKKKK